MPRVYQALDPRIHDARESPLTRYADTIVRDVLAALANAVGDEVVLDLSGRTAWCFRGPDRAERAARCFAEARAIPLGDPVEITPGVVMFLT